MLGEPNSSNPGEKGALSYQTLERILGSDENKGLETLHMKKRWERFFKLLRLLIKNKLLVVNNLTHQSEDIRKITKWFLDKNLVPIDYSLLYQVFDKRYSKYRNLQKAVKKI